MHRYILRLVLIAALSLACAHPAPVLSPDSGPALVISPADALVDEPVHITVDHLTPGEPVTISATWADAPGAPMESHAAFTASATGTLDLKRDAPVAGSYAAADPLGLFWSMRPVPDSSGARATDPGAWSAPQPITLTLHLMREGRPPAVASVTRRFLAPSVRRRDILDPGVTAHWYAADAPSRVAAIVLTGSEGGYADAPAALLASHGIPTLALAYFKAPGLPDELFDVPVETVERGIAWLRRQPGTRAARIVVLGGSKGAELALVSASLLPDIAGVVAYAPSDVVHQGISASGESAARSSWTWRGLPLSFLTQRATPEFTAQFRGPPPFRLRPLFEGSRADTASLRSARIRVEGSRARMLIIAGADDQMLPAVVAARAIARSRRAADPTLETTVLEYPGAGHTIDSPGLPAAPRITGGRWLFGGTPAGLAAADRDSWTHVLNFLERVRGTRRP